MEPVARTARHALAHIRLRVRTAALVAQHIAPPRRARHHFRLQVQWNSLLTLIVAITAISIHAAGLIDWDYNATLCILCLYSYLEINLDIMLKHITAQETRSTLITTSERRGHMGGVSF